MANSFRQDVDSRLAAMTFSHELKQKILDEAMAGKNAGQRRAPVRFARRALTVAAACLAVVFGLAAARLAFPSFDRLVANAGQDVEAFFTPVSLTSVSQGIRMEVVAAINDGDAAIVYITLEDLEGDRIDAGTRIHVSEMDGYDYSVFSELVHFDEQTHVATFRYIVGAMWSELGAKPVTLSIGGLLTGEADYDIENIGYSVADIMAKNPAPQTQPLPLAPPDPTGSYYTETTIDYDSAGVGGAKLHELLENRQMHVLVKDSLRLPVQGYNGAAVSSAGMVDGYLHVRLEALGATALYNRHTLFINYPGRNFDVGYASASIGTDFALEGQQVDKEWIFELPHGVKPEDMTLGLSAVTYSSYIGGDWSVRFRLEEPETASFDVDLTIPGSQIHTVRISQVGLVMEGVSIPGYDYDTDDTFDYAQEEWLVVRMADGEVLRFGLSSSGVVFGEDESHETKDLVMFEMPVRLEDITSVTIYGMVLDLENAV